MATGALDANGVYLYGEDDSEATFSALLNKLGASVSSTLKGKVAQVVTAQTTSQVATSSSTYISTNLSASITPKYATSKILVIGVQSVGKFSIGDTTWQIGLKRDSGTPVNITDEYSGYASPGYSRFSYAFTYLYNATSTSSTTIQTVFRRPSGTDNIRSQPDSCQSSIMLIEVTG